MWLRNGDYILMVAPDDWPGKRYRGKYCYEHHYVYWKHYGVLPGPDEIIHHKDGNKHNNSIENLELLKRGEHTSFHNKERGKILVKLICPICNKEFEREYRQTHLVKKANKYTFCSRKCAGKSANVDIPKDFQNVVEIYRKYYH